MNVRNSIKGNGPFLILKDREERIKKILDDEKNEKPRKKITKRIKAKPVT